MEIVDDVGKVIIARRHNGFTKVLSLRYNGRLSRSQFFCTTAIIFLFMYALYWGLLSVFSTESGHLDNHGFWIFLFYEGFYVKVARHGCFFGLGSSIFLFCWYFLCFNVFFISNKRC